jgi:hypothetical protein
MQAVELSATVGRDLVAVEQSHRKLAQLLFARMRADVDRFVDTVYASYQNNSVMTEQFEAAQSTDPNRRKVSLVLALQASAAEPANLARRNAIISSMQALVSLLQREIEAQRATLRAPIDAQEAEVLAAIDQAYKQLHYASSIVTGHLSSIVKVQDAQDAVLAKLGAPEHLRESLGSSLADASKQLGTVVDKATATKEDVENAVEKIKQIQGQLSEQLSRKTKE